MHNSLTLDRHFDHDRFMDQLGPEAIGPGYVSLFRVMQRIKDAREEVRREAMLQDTDVRAALDDVHFTVASSFTTWVDSKGEVRRNDRR